MAIGANGNTPAGDFSCTSEILSNISEVHGVGFEPTRFYTTALKAVTLTTRSSMLKKTLVGIEPTTFRLEGGCSIH